VIGEKMITIGGDNSSLTIPMEKFSSGLYYLKIRAGGKALNKKIVKE
jgi:hypothetical protein